tara:strand:- start:571 stop:1167 length:597 start_codon:yes stop_codon:yes gene_type:complete
MSCTALTKGRGLTCDRVQGGIKYVYFGVYDDFDANADTGEIYGTGIVVASGEVTGIDMGVGTGLKRYATPIGTSSLVENITGTRDTGTIMYAPQLTLVLNQFTKEDQNEIKLLGTTKVVVFAQLYQQSGGKDVIVCLGARNGMYLNSGTEDSGTAWGDRAGYTLTFDGMEETPAAIVEPYTTKPFDNGAFTNVSVDID